MFTPKSFLTKDDAEKYLKKSMKLNSKRPDSVNYFSEVLSGFTPMNTTSVPYTKTLEIYVEYLYGIETLVKYGSETVTFLDIMRDIFPEVKISMTELQNLDFKNFVDSYSCHLSTYPIIKKPFYMAPEMNGIASLLASLYLTYLYQSKEYKKLSDFLENIHNINKEESILPGMTDYMSIFICRHSIRCHRNVLDEHAALGVLVINSLISAFPEMKFTIKRSKEGMISLLSNKDTIENLTSDTYIRQLLKNILAHKELGSLISTDIFAGACSFNTMNHLSRNISFDSIIDLCESSTILFKKILKTYYDDGAHIKKHINRYFWSSAISPTISDSSYERLNNIVRNYLEEEYCNTNKTRNLERDILSIYGLYSKCRREVDILGIASTLSPKVQSAILAIELEN